jgi:hypothetical protein
MCCEECTRRMSEMEGKLSKMLIILEKQDRSNETVETSCKRMDDHIQFVGSVYNTVRLPLSWVVSKIQRAPSELPTIKGTMPTNSRNIE